MYFKKLEIVGFKSFCSKTVLNFEPGITAIVGPNGCGKSNIFDAIRWVLGEQSVKELRGSDMQDVIFNGTDSKEPLSLAEVALTFDNSQKFFRVDNDEVNITRRLFRSGESEYLLNKTQVRLKDILELLMGTGIGAESYSLIQQGKIDLILSSRPEDRRLVFDEASGITKYKAQKRETLRKLEETEQNLLRVNDIVTEVKRQIGSLERQANKARRYKEVFEELKTKEIHLATLQKKNLQQQKEILSSQLTQINAEEKSLAAAIQQEESRISNRRQELKAFEDNIMSIKNEILNLGNSAARNIERINFNKEKIAELSETKKYLAEQLEQTRSRLILDEEKLNKVKNEYENIRRNIEEKTQLFKNKEDQLRVITTGIRISLENITRSKNNILDFAARIAAAKNEISDLNAKQQILLARQKRLEVEKAKVIEEKNQTHDNLNAISQEVANLENDFQELRLKIADIKQEIEQENSSLANLNLNIDDLEHQKIIFESHKDFLDKLKTKYDDISESLNALIYVDKLPREKTAGLVIKIKDCLQLDEREKALAQFAGFKLSGEAKPIDLDTQNISQKITQLEEKISFLKGERLHKETGISMLNNAVFKQQEALRSQEMILVNKKAQHQTILGQFNKIKEEEEIIALELSDVTGQMSVNTVKLIGLNPDLSKLEQEQLAAEESVHREQASVEANGILKEGAVVIITQTKTELEALNKRISSDEATLRILDDTYQQDKNSFLNMEKQISDSQSRSGTLSSEIIDLENGINLAKDSIASQNAALKHSQAKYDEVSNYSIDVVKKIESDRKMLDEIKNRIYELQMQAKDNDFKYQTIRDRLLQAYKFDLDAPIIKAEADAQVVKDAEAILKDADLETKTLSQMPEALNENALASEIQRLKDKLESYGTVNLVAIEEYDELKKRYDFLTQQQTDLNSAKESLHEAILRINRTTKKMFLDTFEQVCQEFRNYFRLLFNGGDAQIFLVDEQDPLESGIEIICRPPGKKLQNVLLLSGGEKALSAIALVFAIFKVKPAPFCVLDEIDAALDEANVDRYSRLLQEFAKNSQFIVITHNKKTIANADVMYGITMEESGVSKIVSVKFAKDKDKESTRDTDKDKEPEVAPVG